MTIFRITNSKKATRSGLENIMLLYMGI